MLWILEMVFVVVVAHYIIRGIDRLLVNRRNAPVTEELIRPHNFKEPIRWHPKQLDASPYKFPDRPSRAS